MPPQELIEGLKMAMKKGESLEKAMMSFYNAGYSKDDIESAAREVQMSRGIGIPASQFSPQQKQTFQKPKPLNSNQQINPKGPSLQGDSQEPKQNISQYGEMKPKSSGKGNLITLVVVLLVLILGLVGLLFFKDQVIEFFKNLFVV